MVAGEARVSVKVEERHRIKAMEFIGDECAADEDIESLAFAFAEFEREVGGPHGNREERCSCPGCERMVPACWASGLCWPCATEDCDCADRPVSSREAGGEGGE
jgi:hypothetical protein